MNARIAWMVVLMSGSAFAQNALDKPQDKNPQIGSGGLNPLGQDISREMRFRNALVTGNAPGGFSFRGDVGYRAPGEFFGSLGSNDTFSFRRDSYYSGLGGMGIRGTDALQYQIAMTTGNTPPPGLTGSVSFSRSGATLLPEAIGTRETNTVGQEGIRREMPDPFREGSDMRGLSQMTIRSPSAYMANRGLDPTTLGFRQTPDGTYMGVSASPLRGVSFDRAALPGTLAPGADPTGMNPAAGTVPPVPPNPDRLDSKANSEIAPLKPEAKVDTKLPMQAANGRSAYDDLMQRFRGTDANGEPIAAPGKEPAKEAAVAGWQKELDDLRKQLGAESSKRNAMRKVEAPKPSSDTRPPAEKEEPKTTDLRPETVKRIREAGGDVDRLAPAGFDAYSNHMQAGQDHMAAGRFFYAEERFAAALGVKSGDPMAAVGRIHSQLGAGMFLSAAINLRSLFTEHPEVVTLKYKPELMPAKERTATLKDTLDKMSKAKDERRRDSGLLLAYLAFQTGDEAAMKRGLEVAGTPDVAAAEGAAPDQLQKLSSLLLKVWATPRPETPAPAPEPAPEPAK